MIEIKKYNISIDEYSNTGIFANSKDEVKSLLKEIAGINKSDITINDEQVFDNETYFNKRIYIDNDLVYLNTLNATKVQKYMLSNYSKALIKEEFKALVDKLNVRFDCVVKDSYRFKNKSNTIVNDIFALSLMNIRLIYAPFKNIDDINKIDILSDVFKNKRSNIIGTFINNDIDSISKYKDMLDKYIIIYKGNATTFSKDEKIIRISKEKGMYQDLINEIFYEDNKYYYFKDKASINRLSLDKEYIEIYKVGEDND